MVATFKAMGASFNGGYFTASVSEYYSDTTGGEAPGQWFGAGAAALRLSGTVDGKDFRRVLAGNHPAKPKRLVRPCRKNDKPPGDSPGKYRPPRAKGSGDKPDGKKPKERSRRCPAYDVTFSVPKSVSALWAIGDAQTRRQIEQAFDIAVKKTLKWLERNVALARSGRAGKRQVASKLVVAMFDHFVNRSRSWEPHRHRHCVIANMAQRPDGSWTAVNSRELRKWIRALGPLMNVEFAVQLQQRLGLVLERPKDERGRDASWFEVAGVPKSLCKQWSSRHTELHQLLDGQTIKMDQSTAQARDLAFQLTRDKKQRTPPIQVLTEQWTKEAQQHGFDRRAVEQLLHRTKAAEFEPAYQSAWKAAAERLTKSEAYFNFREFLQAVCEELQHVGADATKLARRVKQDLEKSPDIVRLTKLGNEMRYTTKAMWDLEERLLKNVEALTAQSGPLVSEKIVDKVLGKRPQLDQEQRAAVRQILTQRSGLKLLTGVAGSGKSAILDAVREGLERSGARVIGGAISGQAKEELAAKAKIKSRTVESYLYHLDKSKTERLKDAVRHHARMLLRALVGKKTWKQQPIELNKKTVLILDEIGMVDSRSLERITRHALKAGATVIGAGDSRQLQPVLAGGPIHHLIKEVGSAHLTKNYRQKDALDVAMSSDLREGKAKVALDNLAKRDRIKIGANRTDTINKLVDHWVANGGARRPQDHFVFVQTRAEARELNQRLQAERLAKCRTPHTISLKAGAQRLYRGDRVMFNVPCRQFGIENGHRATVLSVKPLLGRMTVRLDRQPHSEPGQRPKKQVVTVSLKALQKTVREPGDQAVSLAYAATTHKLQGGSTEVAYMLVGGQMTDRQMSYTQATRGQQKTFVFVDELHAGEDLKDLAISMSKSRPKYMAHDLAKKPKRERGSMLRHEIVREL
jgi:conjugative relaxase-like TrwC/TraI family protein